MNMFAPLVESFFVERLYQQQRVSPNTVASYRDCFRMLLGFAKNQVGKQPSDLLLTEIDAPLVANFLTHVETQRQCLPQSRNVRHAAIRAFFKYIALREPEHGGLIQRVLALPRKKCEKNLVDYLTRPEMEALLKAPNRSTLIGRRDYALLLVGCQTGLRVSELINLTPEQLQLGKGPYIQCLGKGRKERCVPLAKKTVSVLRGLLQEKGTGPKNPVFESRRGGAMSRDAVELLVERHTAKAAEGCPSLAGKEISPHVLRHTAAMRMLEAGEDTALIALILGHESSDSTDCYLHADLTRKEKALARVLPPSASGARRYKPEDRLISFLNSL